MSYLLDTCILSYLRKDKKEIPKSVQEWFSNKDESLFFLSVVTMAEIEDGIHRLSPSRKKTDLEDWFYGAFQGQFHDKILSIDSSIAKTWGQLNAKLMRKGINIGVQDLYIAATAIVHSLAIVTTNVKDFEPTNVVIFNPWNFISPI